MPQYQAYPPKDAPDNDDILLILDTHDRSDGAAGTTKRTTRRAIQGHGHSGYSEFLGEAVDTATLQASVDLLMGITYAAPAITLSATPAQTLREKGDTVTNTALTAITVKKSSDITTVAFYRNTSDIHDVTSPHAGGGTETYTDAVDFSDTVSYTATADDGTTVTTSNAVTFQFVYPYYYGVGAPGLSAGDVSDLTKAVIAQTNSKSVTTSPSGQVFYFAYPAAYGALISILDTNGFETISDFTLRIENIIGLDSTAQSYRIYEFNHIVTAANFTNTYKL